MGQFRCTVCGYIYDEAKEGKNWNDLPEDWTCPVCGSPKSVFEPVQGGAVQDGAVQDAGKSSEPSDGTRSLVKLHRILGYAFVLIYILFLLQMVPRLWNYQIEFPPRTVAHMTAGMVLGALLLLKILIVRFFRRLDASLAPILGTSLFVCTVVLIGVSAPFAFRGALAGVSGSLFTDENLSRTRGLLAEAGLQDETRIHQLATPVSLRAGRQVLMVDCVGCHDLRTVLARPRTPGQWRETVRRMADRTTVLNPIEEDEQWQVTAYLIAISPQLQRSAREMRSQKQKEVQSRDALPTLDRVKEIAFDPPRARELFERKCSQCHRTSLVEGSPPASGEAAREIVARMVENGLSGSEEELAQIIQYLIATHVKKGE